MPTRRWEDVKRASLSADREQEILAAAARVVVREIDDRRAVCQALEVPDAGNAFEPLTIAGLREKVEGLGGELEVYVTIGGKRVQVA